MKQTGVQTGVLAFCIFLLSAHVSAYNYLVVSPTSASSHHKISLSLAKGLAKAGHHVTLISAFEQKDPVINIKDVTAPGIRKAMDEYIANIVDISKSSVWSQLTGFYDMGLTMAEGLLNDPAVVELMKSNQTFDAVISEVFLNEAHLGFAEHFRAPLIGLSTVGAMPSQTDLVGTPLAPSYVPHAQLHFTDKMSLLQRLTNFGFVTFAYLILNFYNLPRQEALYRKHFPNNQQDFYEMRKNTALVLINEHPSLDHPRPFAPNMIPVGGLHIEGHSEQPLPKDMRQFIEEAEHGVIYCSFGSNVKSQAMPMEMRQAFMDAFGQLKQRVLWKFEDTELPGKPENVFISGWFPQESILAHDKVIIFITHGGLLSVMETIYHRKPFVGIPIFGNQFSIMARSEQNGIGVTLHHKDLTAAKLLAAIQQILQNPEATRKIRDMSARFRDQPETPMERAVFWVEHVSRHKGARYLRSAAQDLNFIQYHSLDVMLIIFGSIFLIMYCTVKLISWILSIILKLFVKNSSPKQNRKVKRN
ncbi:hypothetical protein KR018_000874 [Drosophila ironensis]|nr:hypothetical protein KR018_000874 [Drosophila ironensis]